MSIAPHPPIPELIPQSTPFTVEQRSLLNGFFAGVFSLDGGIKPLSETPAHDGSHQVPSACARIPLRAPQLRRGRMIVNKPRGSRIPRGSG